MKIDALLKELNVSEYIFDKESNIIKSKKNNLFQLRELLSITDAFKKSDMIFSVDENYNIRLKSEMSISDDNNCKDNLAC